MNREKIYSKDKCAYCQGKKGKMVKGLWHYCKMCNGTGYICGAIINRERERKL